MSLNVEGVGLYLTYYEFLSVIKESLVNYIGLPNNTRVGQIRRLSKRSQNFRETINNSMFITMDWVSNESCPAYQTNDLVTTLPSSLTIIQGLIAVLLSPYNDCVPPESRF